MKRTGLLIFFAAMVLSLAMAGCGGKSEEKDKAEAPAAVAAQEEAPAVDTPTQAPAQEQQASEVETEFPLLPDAKNVMDLQGSINYQSGTSMKDSFDFYKKEFSGKGLTENTILTLQEDTVWQLVFTGNENGKNLVVQTTKLDDATININIRYE
jgi:hypothetical protein